MEPRNGMNGRVGQHAPYALQEVAEVAACLEPEKIELEQSAQ